MVLLIYSVGALSNYCLLSTFYCLVVMPLLIMCCFTSPIATSPLWNIPAARAADTSVA